jgi:hypothetical protein
MRIPLMTILLVGWLATSPAMAGIWINELMASNRTTITDQGGGYADWFELYNDGPTAVDLGGWYASDDPLNSRKWQFPAGLIVPAGGFLLLWADDNPLEGIDHVGFHLDALLGEEIALYTSDLEGHTLVDFISYPPQTSDISYGRSQDGGGGWVYFTTSTPAGSNAGGELCDTVTCGDCNEDGSVNILDALRAAQHAAGMVTLTDVGFDNCNVDMGSGSTVVNILDALALARHDLGLGQISCCP